MNTDIKLPPELTELEITEIEIRCEQLAKEHSVSKVHAVAFIDKDTGARTYAFLKEPNFPTKLTVLDKVVSTGIYIAANELMEATLIKEASDPITYGETPECDDYKIGVVNYCVTMIRTKQNIYKKK